MYDSPHATLQPIQIRMASARVVIGGRPLSIGRVVSILVATFSVLILQATAAQAATTCPAGATMNIVAHPDDDLLFQSPDLLHDVQSGKCVRTVYITAGERGDLNTLDLRESGVEAAYAQMAGVKNTWKKSDADVSGHRVPLVTLSGRPTVSLVFMRLPEGVWGSGDSATDATLENLWLGSISQIRAEAGPTVYTRSGLISSLTALMTAFQPDTIKTQDYVGPLGDGDHDDHHAAAYFANAAQLSYTPSHTFVGYLGYATQNKPQNVFDPDLTAKTKAFYAYLQWDSAPCGSPPDCATNDFGQWLKRQYTVSGSTGPITSFASPAADQTVSGTIDVAATAQDQSGTGVWFTAFRVDRPGSDPVAIDYSSPYGFLLDTSTLANGPHTLYARAEDNALNLGPDATVTFNVNN